MSYSVRWKTLAGCLLLAANAADPRPAFGDPVMTIIGRHQIEPEAGEGSILSLRNGRVEFPDECPWPGSLASDLEVDVTRFSKVNRQVDLLSDPPASFTILGQKDGLIVFNINSLGTLGTDQCPYDPVAGTAVICADASILEPIQVLNGRLVDLSPFTPGMGGMLFIEFANVLIREDGTAQWPLRPGEGVEVTFRLIGGAGMGYGAGPVPNPEPASIVLAVCGMLGIAGTVCGRYALRIARISSA
jgi:hypothetical protein